MERRTWLIVGVVAALIVLGTVVVCYMAIRESERILNEFHQINAELDSVSLNLDQQGSQGRNALHGLICPELVQKADSLHLASVLLDVRIDSFRTVLAAAERQNLTVADSLFSAHDSGKRLYDDLLAYFDLAERCCASDSSDHAIDSYATMVRSASSAEAWRERNFTRIPAIACRALLSKCQSDAVRTEALVINDLLTRCMARKSAP